LFGTEDTIKVFIKDVFVGKWSWFRSFAHIRNIYQTDIYVNSIYNLTRK